jgi:hypothetical protein
MGRHGATSERKEETVVTTDAHSRFRWLADEIAQVRTPKFFVVAGPPPPGLREAILSQQAGVPPSYVDFVLQFGNAKLYRQPVGYALGVLGVPQRAETPTGEELMCIGHYDGRRAYFKVATLATGVEAPVYERGASGLKRAAESFEQWLHERAAAIRNRLGKRRWAQIVEGPAPFSLDETEIVEARRKFRWRKLGIAEDGDVEIEVTNESDRTLPFFGIGVRSHDGEVNGAVWLKTSELAPGETRRFKEDLYKNLVKPQEVELFSLPDPGPEDRERYREFR